MKVIDITQELFSCNVYPGDNPPSFKRVKNLDSDGYNLTNISLSVHNGTHMDAPGHFVKGGKSVDELDLSIFYGDCTVAELSGVTGKAEMSAILKTCKERLIIKGEFKITKEAAEAVANSHIRLIGIESQSVGTLDDPVTVHMILLQKGIIPLEGLVLSNVKCGEYILSALPLNLNGSDGSPVRAVLIEI